MGKTGGQYLWNITPQKKKSIYETFRSFLFKRADTLRSEVLIAECGNRMKHALPEFSLLPTIVWQASLHESGFCHRQKRWNELDQQTTEQLSADWTAHCLVPTFFRYRFSVCVLSFRSSFPSIICKIRNTQLPVNSAAVGIGSGHSHFSVANIRARARKCCKHSIDTS